MSKRLNALVVAIACLLMLPVMAFAQTGFPLPTPTRGWNMGNTLEPPSGEGSWGGVASEPLINAVADAGFNAVRIPVAWNSHANQTTYEIDPAWMARVKQVVDWCYARNLPVLINCHWDNGWLDSSIDGTVDPTIDARVEAYWTQIANTFRDYDGKLMFNCANEPDADTAAEVAELMHYYQTFVDAVRATGGQNTNRWLVISGPQTNIDHAFNLMNTLPNDPTPNRLAIEVHDYTPFNYTLMTSDQSWGNMFYFWGEGYLHPTRTDRNPTWGEIDYIQGQYQKMKTKFVDQGIPVIVGEYHAGLKSGFNDLTGWDFELHKASRTNYHKTIQDTANSYGLKPFYWDTTGGFYDFATGTVTDQANIDALTRDTPLPSPINLPAPAAPGSLAASAASDIQINLTWADNSSSEYIFELQRATDSSFSSGVVTTTFGIDRTSGAASGLTPSSTYYFLLRTVNPNGTSAWSNTASATTQAGQPGKISQEVWSNVSGTTVSSIPVGTTPAQTGVLTSFEGATNWADNYGQRIRGYLTAPVTGSYTFWIASDDNSELWLSTSSDPAGKVRIASVSDWTNSREWNKFATQKSAPINLVAGTNYYIEALHKEGAGGDNLAVGWAKPGQGTTAPSEVIPGTQLSPWDGGGTVTVPTAPSSLAASAASSSQINLNWVDNASNEANFELQRATNSSFSSGLVTTTLGANTTSASATGLASSTTYYFRVRATNSAGASAYSNTASATTQSGGAATSTSVAAITVTTVNIGQGRKRGQASVTVWDNLGNVVSGATVTGNFTGTINESGVSAVTNASGVATLTTNGSAKGGVSVTFCVTNVTAGGLSYNASGNTETCDSN